MVSSARQSIACILLIFGTAIYAQSQTAPEKGTASVSGKVTIKGKGVPGIMVVLLMEGSQWGSSWGRSHPQGTTDQTGNYRITNVPAGTYQLSAITPALVVENDKSISSLVIAAGETLDDINLSLVRGGVITGKITDAEGQPVTEESVNVEPVFDQSGMAEFHGSYMRRLYGGPVGTDDRGVYRAFGLPRGKYKVSVGRSDDTLPGRPQELYKKIFYPSVTDSAKATVIEVTEGSEVDKIDIVIGRPVTTFKVIGRIVDAETGRPVPNIKYGVGQEYNSGDGSSGGQSTVSGAASDIDGKFKLENVVPGRYTVFIVPPEQSEMRAESVTFNVVDRDLTDLVIKTSKGASLSGVIVLEGNHEKAVAEKLRELPVYASVLASTPTYHSSPHAVAAPDGSFKIVGLPSGRAHISFGSTDRVNEKQFEIVRIERDGVPQPGGIEVKEGDHVTGVRVVVKHINLTGAIRGQLKVEDGELPPSKQLSVSVFLLNDDLTTCKNTSSDTSPQVDSRGRFFLEGLAAGTYEVHVAVFEPGQRRTENIYQKQVTVVDNTVSEVTITLKLKPKPDP